jgi:hypothetical protein
VAESACSLPSVFQLPLTHFHRYTVGHPEVFFDALADAFE